MAKKAAAKAANPTETPVGETQLENLERRLTFLERELRVKAPERIFANPLTKD